MMNRLNYNDWMLYIYNTLNNTDKKPAIRTTKEIQKEIDYLRAKDWNTSEKIRATYSIKK